MLVGVLAVPGIAIADAMRSEPSASAGGDPSASDGSSSKDEAAGDLIGPFSPESGALPGFLVVTRGQGCMIQTIDLAELTFGKLGPETGCRLWVSPDGARAAAAKREAPVAQPVALELFTLEGRPESAGEIGPLLGPPS